MKTAQSLTAMREMRRRLPEPVGFVPTMGFLHEGHLSLVRRARSENQAVVVSIFVNPTQFGPNEDFAAYPRDVERDLALLHAAGADVVFVPPTEEMYPPNSLSWVVVDGITTRLEGASRPGHFRGVATVVAKLFNITRPAKAYFGQKDAQQVLVISRMVADLNMNLEIVTCPTLREPDGLAMSSRNVYLTQEERRAAPVLWESLRLAQRLWAGGERQAQPIRQQMTDLLQAQPRASIDYVSVADAETLEELEVLDRPPLVSLAVRIGRTRLIDNLVLDDPTSPL